MSQKKRKEEADLDIFLIFTAAEPPFIRHCVIFLRVGSHRLKLCEWRAPLPSSMRIPLAFSEGGGFAELVRLDLQDRPFFCPFCA